MFILSTTHIALALSELLQGFVYELQSIPGGPPVFYRINVFPKRKAVYIVNVRVSFDPFPFVISTYVINGSLFNVHRSSLAKY